jgi:hypothetical protein
MGEIVGAFLVSRQGSAIWPLTLWSMVFAFLLMSKLLSFIKFTDVTVKKN